MSKVSRNMKRRTMWVAEEVWDRLEKVALENGYTVSDLIRRAIAELLKKEEKDV